jgi:DNA-binding CsgD family transcriptional regulator
MAERPFSGGRTSAPRTLTPMQRKVLRLCSLGCTVKETARILGLSPSTVDNYKTRAMARARVRNLAELTRFVIRARISTVRDKLTEEETRRLHAPHQRLRRPRRPAEDGGLG